MHGHPFTRSCSIDGHPRPSLQLPATSHNNSGTSHKGSDRQSNNCCHNWGGHLSGQHGAPGNTGLRATYDWGGHVLRAGRTGSSRSRRGPFARHIGVRVAAGLGCRAAARRADRGADNRGWRGGRRRGVFGCVRLRVAPRPQRVQAGLKHLFIVVWHARRNPLDAGNAAPERLGITVLRCENMPFTALGADIRYTFPCTCCRLRLGTSPGIS